MCVSNRFFVCLFVRILISRQEMEKCIVNTTKVNIWKLLAVAMGLNSRPEPGPKSSTQARGTARRTQARGPARPDALKPEPGPKYTRKFLEITMVDCC